MHFDPSTTRAREIFQLMTSLIVPRPIAWVGTRSTEGIDNIAPFSFFMGVSGRPPTIAFACASKRDGTDKDTARNILATGAFTVSVVPTRLAEAMNQTSAAHPPEISEFDAVGLLSVPGQEVAAPRPEASPATMECKLVHHHALGTTHLFVGEIVWITVDDEVLDGHTADIERLDPVARLGGNAYAPVRDVFEIQRPL